MTDATSGDPSEVLSDATKVLSDPTGVLFGLEGEFRVLFVQRIGPTAVKMIIEQIAREGPCPVCGGAELGGEGSAADAGEGSAGLRADRRAVVA
jgi:hypothetical protein